MTERAAPRHPGDILLEDFMEPTGMRTSWLAAHAHIPETHLRKFINGEIRVDRFIAHRLSLFFGTTAEMWYMAQGEWDHRPREAADSPDPRFEGLRDAFQAYELALSGLQHSTRELTEVHQRDNPATATRHMTHEEAYRTHRDDIAAAGEARRELVRRLGEAGIDAASWNVPSWG